MSAGAEGTDVLGVFGRGYAVARKCGAPTIRRCDRSGLFPSASRPGHCGATSKPRQLSESESATPSTSCHAGLFAPSGGSVPACRRHWSRRSWSVSARSEWTGRSVTRVVMSGSFGENRPAAAGLRPPAHWCGAVANCSLPVQRLTRDRLIPVGRSFLELLSATCTKTRSRCDQDQVKAARRGQQSTPRGVPPDHQAGNARRD